MTRERATTFTSLGSEDSTDELFHYCTHHQKQHPKTFCTHCSEFLCDDCYRSHSTRHQHIASHSNNTDSPTGHVSTIKVRQVKRTTRKEKKTNKEDGFAVEMQVFSETPLQHLSEERSPVFDFNNSKDIKSRSITPNLDPHYSGASSQPQSVICNGSLKIGPKQLSATAVHETDICCAKISKPSRITGMIEVDNNLVLTDYTNNSVKVIDTQSRTIMSEMTFSNGPWDLTRISDGKIAVTLTKDKKIAFLHIDRGELILDREVVVLGYCDGIASYNDMLLVTYINPGKLEILDLDGQYLGTFESDSTEDNLFQEPRHVALDPDRNWLYVSDFLKNAVTCFSIDGTIQGVYTDSELQGPENIAVDSAARVYVCGGNSNNIHLISASCEKLCVLLTRNDGLRYPQSLFCCVVTMKLYVGMDGNSHIMVYKIQYNLQEGKRKKNKKKADNAIIVHKAWDD